MIKAAESEAPMTRSPVIDVHTHMLTNEWVSLLEQHGGPALHAEAGERAA